MASLKRLYGLREMAVDVPEKDMPAFRELITAAAAEGILPKEAPNWILPSGTPAGGVPQTSAPKKPRGKKAQAAQAQQPAAAPPMSADTRAALDKGQSAWDQLAQQPAAPAASAAPPPAQPAAQKVAPAAGGMFDPSGGNIQFDPRSQGLAGSIPGWDDNLTEPQAANVDLKKGKKPGMLGRVFGQKPKDQAQQQGNAMQPKQGALKKVFGKKGPKVKGSARDDDPGVKLNPPPPERQAATPDQIATATRKGRDFVSQGDTPDWTTGPDGSAEDPMGDLSATLAQNPAIPAHLKGGQSAMNDLTWDLKRLKGKR